MDQSTYGRRLLSVLVDNEPGVLSQVARLFTRKGHNIISLASGPTQDPRASRLTIEVMADDAGIGLLCNQLRKLLAVRSVKLLDALGEHGVVRREMVLVKVATPDTEAAARVMQVADIFRAQVIDVSADTMTLAVIGEENKTDAMMALVDGFGVLELVRTGMVAIERGPSTIYERTKERGEFEYGKQVNG